jgi:integrase
MVFDYGGVTPNPARDKVTVKLPRETRLEPKPPTAEHVLAVYRVPERRVFQGFGADRLRTAIARACNAAGVPSFSPHDLRHRPISLEHLRGQPWARIGELVG